ncbi:Leucine-rich repeat (LRR) protein [Dysgonomonas sp. PH5-45]|uniref:DUF6383 domain-containing protein n=1 Tax=unclassified Dysgonomonas TaxID=2630389 RepID=UPI002473FF69|nr:MULTISPECIES: DUF6383 domain-containing protein [unclassified Dysgonomonas]MDH6355193.1 Leucine-rich repeat (LRR) protein [Dysgonomonas sp. PH5-45]MDH6388081.1 Leucine-rich repeat (LRR) protein [Dysgonomonas sp. PH5-37]
MKKLLLFSAALLIGIFYIIGQEWQTKAVTDYETPAITMTTTDEVQNQTLTITVKANAAGNIMVDFGNDTQVSFTATANSTLNMSGTVAGSSVKVYTPDGMSITDLQIKGIAEAPALKTINITALTGLKMLTLSYHKFTTLDVSKNTELVSATCTYTDLAALNLNSNKKMHTINCSYNKLRTLTVNDATTLKNITCNNNQLSQLKLSDTGNGGTVEKLVCSDNKLTALDLTKNTWLSDIECANNELTTLNLTGQNSSWRVLNVANNKLTELILPASMNGGMSAKKLYCENNQIAKLDVPLGLRYTAFHCYGNNLKYSTLPILTGDMNSNVKYAPQNGVVIPRIGTVADLSSEYTVNGVTTEYKWFKTSGTLLLQGTDYTFNAGVTTFTREQDEDVYGVLSNTTFPDFDLSDTDKLKTMPITITSASNMGPVITMEATEAYKGSSLSIRMTPTTSGNVYVDYGNGYFEPFTATANTTLNAAKPCQGKDVTVYLPKGMDLKDIRVNGSSTTSALSSIDLSQIDSLNSVILNYNAIERLDLTNKRKLETLTVTYGTLKELILTGDTLLTTLSLYSNELETLDFTGNYKVRSINANTNKLKSVNTSALPELYLLDVSGNELTSIDVSKNGKLSNFKINSNKIAAIDVSKNLELSDFNCYDNELGALDLSTNKKISNLQCGKNKLTAIDVTQLGEKLTTFRCEDNLLTSIDVSKNEFLRQFHCQNNQLTELDITQNPSINNFFCHNNQLRTLDLSKQQGLMQYNCSGNYFKFSTLPSPFSIMSFTYAPQHDVEIPASANIVDFSAEDSISVDMYGEKKTFYTTYKWTTSSGTELTEGEDYKIEKGVTTFLKPQQDSVFCTLANEAFHSFKDNNALKTTMTKVVLYNPVVTLTTTDDAQEKRVTISVTTDAEGTIKADFGDGNLTDFEIASAGRGVNIQGEVNGNNITLYASSGMNITALQANGSSSAPYYSTLDVSTLTTLTSLSANYNALTALDLTNNTALKTLNVANNQLASIDVSKNVELTTLNLANNKLADIDVSKLTDLQTLNIQKNELTSLNVSANTALKTLEVFDNGLSILNVSTNTHLETLNLQNNQITGLNLTGNTGLRFLNCANNKLTALNLATNTNLSSVNCSNNEIASLDLNNSTKAHTLDCSSNKLTSLSINLSVGLKNIICSSNQLTALELPDAGDGGNIANITCSDNKITSLDLSKNNLISILVCANNLLTELSVADQTIMRTLNVANNKLTTLNLPESKEMKYLNCENNMLTELTLPTVMWKTLECYGNKLKFSTLPTPFYAEVFNYAPQEDIEIPATINVGNELDLSSEYKIGYQVLEDENMVDKTAFSAYKWITTAGTELVEGTDYTITDGKTTFLKAFDAVYCVLENELFPNFEDDNQFKTSVIKVEAGSGITNHQVQVCIYALNQTIFIEGQNGANVTVYTITGKAIATARLDSDYSQIPMEAQGVFIVKLTNNGHTTNHKVLIK